MNINRLKNFTTGMKSHIYFKFIIVFIFLCLANITSAATLSFYVDPKAYTVGSDIKVDILISSESKSADTVSGLVSFPKNLLSVSSISRVDSIVGSWVQEPSFSNTTGNINFESVLKQELTGNLGKILTIVFKAKSAGTANVKFIAGSILTTENITRNILSNSDSIFLTINEVDKDKQIVSTSSEEIEVSSTINTVFTTNLDSNGWYSLDNTNLTRIPAYRKIPVILIISILLFIFLLWYMYHNFSSKNNKLKKEVYEAEDALHKAFDILKESEKEQIKTLEKTKPKPKSVVEKEKIKRQFKKDINDAEKYIEKEIDDIDKLVNTH